MAVIEFTDKQEEIINDLNKSSYRHICLYGGGRSGKTTFLMYMLFIRALEADNSYHVIIRDTHTSMKSSIFEQTINKILSFDNFKTLRLDPELKKNKQDLTITFPNGSIIYCYGLNTENAVERILGNEYSTIYYNECSSLDYSRITPIRSRLAQKSGLGNKFFYDFNPPLKSHWTYKYFVEKKDPVLGHDLQNDDEFYIAKINPFDNLSNIDEFYLKEQEYAGSDHYKRFVEGEFQNEIQGALFTLDMIRNANNCDFKGLSRAEIRAKMDFVVIGVDPAVTSTDASDLTGIIVCGFDGNNYYILEDASGQHTPYEWAGVVSKLYDTWQANTVVVETNQGGDLLTENIRSFGRMNPHAILSRYMHIEETRAKNGKRIRAEPIATMYAQGKVFHIQYYNDNTANGLIDLENEMLSFTGNKDEKSPDRLDALVHALQYMQENGFRLDKTEFFSKI